MIKLENVSLNFGTTEIAYPDWEIPSGNQALILGQSGSGKTTLLHLLTGLLKPSSGKITIEDKDISSMGSKELDAFRGKHVGIIFQKPHLISSLTVGENIRLGGKFNGKKITKSRLSETSEALGISELLNRKIYQLSEGQSQRVSIARAVIHEPAILAADEPTASLDDSNCESVIQLLKEQAQQRNATLLIATHDQRVKDQFETSLEL